MSNLLQRHPLNIKCNLGPTRCEPNFSPSSVDKDVLKGTSYICSGRVQTTKP